MPQFSVKFDVLRTEAGQLGSYERELESIRESLSRIGSAVQVKGNAGALIRRNIIQVENGLTVCRRGMAAMGDALTRTAQIYENGERRILDGQPDKGGASQAGGGSAQSQNSDTGEVSDDRGLLDLLLKLIGKAGIAGGTVSLLANWFLEDDALKRLLTGGQNLSGILGNVASASGNGAWYKYIFGLNKPYKNTPTSFVEAWDEELRKYVLKNSDDAASVAKVGSKWAGQIFSFLLNGYENYQEYGSGEISGGRAVMETFGETAVDFGIATGLTALLGLTGAPVVVVGVGAALATWGLDSLSEAFTGKDLSEFVSDTVLDFGEWVGEKAARAWEGVSAAWDGICEGAENAWDTVCDGASAAWDSICDGASGLWSAVFG